MSCYDAQPEDADDYYDLTCSLDPGHEGDHEALDGEGGKILASWPRLTKYTVTWTETSQYQVTVEAASLEEARTSFSADYEEHGHQEEPQHSTFTTPVFTPDPEPTWTFCGHWDGSRVVIEYELPGEVADQRVDVGQHPEGLWASSYSAPTLELAQALAPLEYENGDPLSDIVHDVLSRQASQIVNDGSEIEFLLSQGWTDSQIAKAIDEQRES